MKTAFALWFVVCLGTAAACGGGGGGNGGHPDATGTGKDSGGGGGEDATPPPPCGNGTLDPGEVCDDGNADSNDGCAGDCSAVEPGWACADPGTRCVHPAVCGDGFLEIGETCDDRNTAANDGCSASCQLEAGWKCPVPGIRCTSAACGDGIVAGFEECDDGNTADGDGCSKSCIVEEGHACGAPGTLCPTVVCGNGVREGAEQCDDGNHDLGDGCDPLCHREPQCTNGTCVAVCGDGVIQPGEACDDGNVRDFDGCAHDCTVERGFACTAKAPGDQDTFAVSIVYRDFMGHDIRASYNPDGAVIGHPDFESGNDNKVQPGMVGRAFNVPVPTPPTPIGTLDALRHKPQYVLGSPLTTHGQAAFDQWYRDVPAVGQTPAVNITIAEKLVLVPLLDMNNVRVPGSYVYENPEFFPLDGRGFTAPGGPEVPRTPRPGTPVPHNFSFTSELRYWFTYKGNENLSFIGDDDVWVFINNRLAVDIGGVHGMSPGSVTLTAANAAADKLDLHVGGTYEAALFQAERHTSKSTYKLTLAGFDAVRSDCQSVCGDGITASDEVCDDGVNNGGYNSCAQDCKGFGPRCGDGHVDAGHEACDDGLNTGAYGTCTPTCELGPRCGDGIVQANHDETCDDGNTDPNDGCDQCQVVLQ